MEGKTLFCTVFSSGKILRIIFGKFGKTFSFLCFFDAVKVDELKIREGFSSSCYYDI